MKFAVRRRLPLFSICLGLLLGAPLISQAQRPMGIDVSHYQGAINWTSVKGSGIVFAWTKATEGTSYVDPYLDDNEAGAKTAGVYIGAYHFARPDLNLGTAGADAEAAHYWAVTQAYIKNTGGYLMPMLDVEGSPGSFYNRTTLSQWVNRWCQDIVNSNAPLGVTVKPVIYCSSSFAGTWFDSSVAQWIPWIANWNGQNPQTGGPSPTSPWPTWTVWQYSSTTSVPGISGNVDGDVFNGTLNSLLATLVIGGGTPPPVIVTPPQNQFLPLATPALFTVNATGTGPLRFQWRFNQTNIAGATATNYNVPSAQLANAGAYSVSVSNAGGVTLSAPGFLSVMAPLTNAPGCVLGPSGMVNWWPADGHANDIFGGRNATPHNGFSYAPGKQIRAFHFDGATSYLTTGTASLPVPWTACLWVNRQNAPGGGAALLGDGTYEVKLEQYNGTRQVGVTQFGVGDYSFGYIVPVNTWTHLAFVGTSTGTSLYVNGALQASLTNSLPLPRAYIGVGYASSSGKLVDYLLGNVDELMMFNRALSASEINAIYVAGSAGLVRAPEFTGGERLSDNQFRVSLRGQTGKSFTLYRSDDTEAWKLLGTFSNPAGSTQLVDDTATNAQAIYRASQPQ